VADLAVDTAVERVDERRFRAIVRRDWEIWGPMGGYMAAIALRAVGAVSRFDRPASFFCHFLGVAAFDSVDLTVTELRSGGTAAAHRVQITQEGRPILEGTAWSIGAVEGLEHDLAEAPSVAGPDGLRNYAELRADAGAEDQEAFAFWDNVEGRPVDARDWPPPEPLPPIWQQWCRFRPAPTFADPWVDACRSLILVDIQGWPSAWGPHAAGPQTFYAPSLDLYVAFHDPQPESEWLLCDGAGPIARHGLLGWTGRLWSTDGHLVASGAGQLLSRRLPSPPPD
jgi:acyl-CoA thioesterase-2